MDNMIVGARDFNPPLGTWSILGSNVFFKSFAQLLLEQNVTDLYFMSTNKNG